MAGNIDNEILKQHIDSIRAQLRDLNYTYQLNYVFSFAYKNNNVTQTFVRGSYYNRLINHKILDDFIMDLIQLRRELGFWLNLINQDYHVVYCLQDTHKLYPGHELFNGKMYLVEGIVVDRQNNSMRFLIHNHDSGIMEGGYEYTHFMRLMNYTSNN